MSMAVVALANSLWIHQVRLALLQVGAIIYIIYKLYKQIRAPPLHRRQLTQSRNSKR